MLGYFIEKHRPIHNESETHPGMPLVAVVGAAAFEDNGLADRLHFGIAGRNGQVVSCVPRPGTPEAPDYEVQSLSLADFVGKGSLFSYDIPVKATDEKVTERAEAAVGTRFHGLRSFPGDDFVMECFTGYEMARFMKDHPHVGTHLQTPLRLSPSLLLRELFGSDLGLEETDWLQCINPDLYEVTHHGLRIENQHVIHFATCRVPDETNQVKWDTLETFRHVSSPKGHFTTVRHAQHDAAARLQARNTAVYHFLHRKEYGPYHPLLNNCEHLCYLCTEGEKRSPQVTDGVIGLMKLLAKTLPTLLIPGKVPVKVAITATSVILEYLKQRNISE